VENSRELDRVIDGYPAELRVGHRVCISAQAKDSGILIRERLRECGAVGEVLVQNLLQLGMRDAQPFAPDSRHSSRRRGDRVHSEGHARRPFQSHPQSQHVAILMAGACDAARGGLRRHLVTLSVITVGAPPASRRRAGATRRSNVTDARHQADLIIDEDERRVLGRQRFVRSGLI